MSQSGQRHMQATNRHYSDLERSWKCEKWIRKSVVALKYDISCQIPQSYINSVIIQIPEHGNSFEKSQFMTCKPANTVKTHE